MRASKLEELHEQDPTSDAFYAAVYNFAKKIVYNRVPRSSEDIAQQVCVAVFQNLKNYDQKKSNISYFIKMTADSVTNKYLATLYEKPEAQLNDDFEIPALTLDPDSSYLDLLDVFSEDKDVLDLFLQGYNVTEIGQMLGLTRKALRWKMAKASKRAAATKRLTDRAICSSAKQTTL